MTLSEDSLSSIDTVYINRNETVSPKHAELTHVHKPRVGEKPKLKKA